jgi:hypothetical protein
MADAKIVTRIRRLLRLAQSSEPHEAANALAHAQRLMHQHRIERLEVGEDDETIALYSDEPIDSARDFARWRQALGEAISEANDCLCLLSERRIDGHRIMVLAGRREDFEVARAMYRWITTTIDEESREWSRREPRGIRWLVSFRTGAAAVVEERLARELQDQRAQLTADPSTSRALARRADAVREWADENANMREAADVREDYDRDGWARGAALGRAMQLRPGGAK